MFRQIGGVVVLVLLCFCAPAHGDALPGLKGSIIQDFDYWSPPRPVSILDGNWLVGRMFAMTEMDPPGLDLGGAFCKAVVHAVYHRPTMARLFLEKAVVEVPHRPEPYAILAAISLREGRYADAELAYLKAMELLEKRDDQKVRAAVLDGLAGVAEGREKWADAQKHLEELLKLDPKNPAMQRLDRKNTAMQRLARAMFHQGYPVEAFRLADKGYNLDPRRNVAPEVLMARLYEEYCGANTMPWMRSALKKHPGDARTLLAMAELALERGATDIAHTNAEKALQIDHGSLDAMLLRGIVAMFEKDYPMAEKYFQDVLARESDNFAARNDLALVLCEQQDTAKKKRAVELAEANWSRTDRNDAEAVVTYARALYRQGEVKQAERVIDLFTEKRIAITPYEAYCLACVLHDLTRDTDALRLLDSACYRVTPFRWRFDAQELKARLDAQRGH